MEIKTENITAAFSAADDNTKKVLLALFPDILKAASVDNRKPDTRPVTERVKTFEDALNELGTESRLVQEWEVFNALEGGSTDLEAYLKLRIICAALNEGWEPDFTEEETRWFPWFWLYTEDELQGKNDAWKKDTHLIETSDYQTEYAGFAFA